MTLRDTAWTWSTPFSLQVHLACGALTLLAVAWSLRHLPRTPWRRPLQVLRPLAALLLLVVAGQPSLVRTWREPLRSRFAVVVDRSASMALPEASGGSRAARVAALLRASDGALQRRAARQDVEFYDLERRSDLGSLGDPAQPPRGLDTDLLRALERAARPSDPASAPLGGMLLLSDGADHGSLPAVGDANGLRGEVVQRLVALGAPVNTMAASAPRPPVDLAFGPLRGDAYAFLRNSTQFSVTLRSSGLPALRLPVVWRRNGIVMATEELAVAPDATTEIAWTHRPEALGDAIYSVEVPVQAGEVDAVNNVARTTLTVHRDKLRVLHVAGRPSWDERFLRQHLKENPNVDVVSFFILRTPSSDLSVPEAELSLIPFPVDQLFTSELSSFDAVIFQNFDFRPFHMERYLPNLRRAIEEGLGFIMLGGSQSLDFGGYAGTPLEAILPVRLRAAPQGQWQGGPIRPQPVAQRARHPALTLAQDAAENAAAWRALPPWRGANGLLGAAAEAVTLLVDPRHRTATGQPMPLLAARDAGRGRTMVVATDELWRWRFSQQTDGQAATAYARLWTHWLRWLVHDPVDERLRVWPTQRRFEPDAGVQLRLRLVDAAYQPIRDAQIALSLRRDGRLVDSRRTTFDEAAATAAGWLHFEGLAEGAYRVDVEARRGSDGLGSAHCVFLVQSASQEKWDRDARGDLLAALAAQTGGKALPLLPGSWDQLAENPPASKDSGRREQVDLWDNGWVLLTLVTLLCVEWYGRRRIGVL